MTHRRRHRHRHRHRDRDIMGFFDLNIPYNESDRHTTATDKSTLKTTRLKLTIKSLELGYVGVAYNRTIKGVMSESDRCSISPFPLSSLLNLSPSLSSSVKFRRQLLNIPITTPFRQYTRLTVVVDSPGQALALNSGNPILRSYDVVAVRPTNQISFEQACQASEVDLIAIDFSEKLPFRLKQPVVKAAIERGLYFEITYSGLIMDAQVRRQMISNVKLLVDWTRGKNLIISSAAPSVTELRGPYDVANLSSLFGLPMEHAKTAISKNCRSLITNALRKKHCYKEVIRVEAISSGGQIDSKEPAFDDWLKWDPISSGDGDLLLDEMAVSFRASANVSKTVKAIDFTSVVDSLPSHGLQIKDFISVAKVASVPPDIDKTFSSGKCEEPVAINGVSEQSESLNILPAEDHTSLNDAPVKYQTSCSKNSLVSFSPTGTLNGFPDNEVIGTQTPTIEEEPKISDGSNAYSPPTEVEMHDLQSQSCVRNCEAQVMFPGDTRVHTLAKDMETRDDVVSVVGGLPIGELCDDIKNKNAHSVVNGEQMEVAMEEQPQIDHTGRNYCILNGSLSGKRKVQQRTSHRSFLFPFKHLLNPVPFKKKARKLKRKFNHVRYQS